MSEIEELEEKSLHLTACVDDVDSNIPSKVQALVNTDLVCFLQN